MPSRVRAFRRALMIAPLCGLLFSLGTAPFHVPALIWLGFAPLAWVALRPELSVGQRFFVGWVGGLPTGLVGFQWLTYTIRQYADLPLVAAWGLHFSYAAWMAVPFGIWAMGVAELREFSRRVRVIGAAALWVALAGVWPLVFPYTLLIGFGDAPAWMQLAELGGVPLLEFLVVAAGVGLVDELRTRPSLRRVLIFLAYPLFSGLFGLWRLSAVDKEIESARHIRVGLVQPNIPLKWPKSRKKMERLWAASEEAEREGAELIVWPEAGNYPYVVRRPFERDAKSGRAQVMRRHHTPTIFGAASEDARGRHYNSAYLMDADGEVLASFDKVNPVPFGERVLFVDPEWALKTFPSMSHIEVGAGATRFPVPLGPEHPAASSDVHVGPLICYEDIIPAFAREAAALPGGIHAFVNVTIDAWYGPIEQWEHLSLAQFRSVEHRIPMLRAVSTGVSASIDAGGRIAALAPARSGEVEQMVAPEVVVHDVALSRNTQERPTIYAQIGWVFLHLCQALCVFGALWRLREARR